ncbi:sigma factor [Thermosulfurimonas sp. F29]|uniref:sigma factor n=1 Tax=Thermosulfurimonas sp. F29 TaxID=2867247 RepID=UPI001C83816C|nr:sigma factor [Thermosulfurimonas sp. F29]MBX6423355.1 hypothetical protein [Thermosulfurimonas sp. F29]
MTENLTSEERRLRTRQLLTDYFRLKRAILRRVLLNHPETFRETFEAFLLRFRGTTLPGNRKKSLRTVETQWRELVREAREVRNAATWRRALARRNRLAGTLIELGFPLEDLKPFMTPAEWNEGRRLRNAIFELNLPLARHVLSRWKQVFPHEETEDLQQVAAEALLKAIDHVVPSKAHKFATYVFRAVWTALKRFQEIETRHVENRVSPDLRAARLRDSGLDEEDACLLSDVEHLSDRRDGDPEHRLIIREILEEKISETRCPVAQKSRSQQRSSRGSTVSLGQGF